VNPDSLRATLDSVFAGPAYRWVERPRPFAWLRRWWDALMDGLRGLETGHPAVYWAIVGLLIAGLVAIVVHLVVVAARTIRYATATEAVARAASAPARDAAWYRRRAEQLAREGQAAEAVQAAFQALVLELSAAGLVRYHPSKTPREYLREARLADDDRERFRGLVDTMYGYAFAGLACGPGEYTAWRAAAEGGWRAAGA
jgi:hypothetical protein